MLNLRKVLFILSVAVSSIIFCAYAFKSEPSIKISGVYQSDPHAYSEYHTFYHYLRFYPDDTVISVSSLGSPADLSKWFTENSPDSVISKGRYTINGARIKFKCISKTGKVDYEGKIEGDSLVLKSHSHISGHRATETYHFVEDK